jgi:hypothetical protein
MVMLGSLRLYRYWEHGDLKLTTTGSVLRNTCKIEFTCSASISVWSLLHNLETPDFIFKFHDKDHMMLHVVRSEPCLQTRAARGLKRRYTISSLASRFPHVHSGPKPPATTKNIAAPAIVRF